MSDRQIICHFGIKDDIQLAGGGDRDLRRDYGMAQQDRAGGGGYAIPCSNDHS